MEEKNFIINTLELLTIVIFYYIVGNEDIFVYVLSLSLYNIFKAYFKHLSFKESFDKINDNYDKYKFLNIAILYVSIIGLLFLILGIVISDISSAILKIKDVFFPFLIMGISILSYPISNLLLDYLNSTKRNKKEIIIFNIYNYLRLFLFIIISLLLFRVFKIPSDIKISCLYLPDIISTIIISVLVYIMIKKDKYVKSPRNIKYNYNSKIKAVITKNNNKIIIDVIKNSYYYISIIILYFILSTRYGYATSIILSDITFVYFYFLAIINYFIYVCFELIIKHNPFTNITNYMYLAIKKVFPLVIIFSIVSPLTCQLIFNITNKFIYLIILNFLAIFIILYDITNDNLKSTKILLISAVVGIVIKLLITIPLIDAFYRMGYNLIYGDILSTIFALLFSIIINYVSANNKSVEGSQYLDKILDIFYLNIILTIILIVLEFIVPIKSNSYLKSIFLMILYLIVGFGFIQLKNKYIKKKRGKK